MIALGLVLGWMSVFLIPVAQRVGMSETLARKLPFAGLFLGLAWGLIARVSRNATAVLSYLGGTALLGVVFWCLGLLIGGLIILFGGPQRLADQVPIVAFCAGVALGVVAASAPVVDWFDRLRTQRRRRRDRVE